MAHRLRIMGRVANLQGDGHDVPMHARHDHAFIAANAAKDTREHAKQYLGRLRSTCVFVSRADRITE